MPPFLKPKIIILLIFLSSLFFRLYGLNWDQGFHLHPDERFLTMVSADIKLPSSIFSYFDTANSPLNPYNYSNYQFFVYGNFPVFFTKLVGEIFNLSGYDQIYLVGRFLSAVFDSLNIFLLYFLSLKLFSKKSFLVFLPSLIYCFCVLPLQLSHFFAVDTYLSFFILLTFTLLIYHHLSLSAIAFGLAAASKISAVYFAPIIIIYFLYQSYLSRKFFRSCGSVIVYFLIAFLSFRCFQPYAFTQFLEFNPHFIDNLKTLQSFGRPDSNFPPSVQWLSKIPLLFSLQNLVFWGLGLPLVGLFLFVFFKNFSFRPSPIITLSLVWIILLYFYQGSQFIHAMRYFSPIYPFICLVVGFYCQKISVKIISFFLILHSLFGLSFLTIYSHPHSRVQSSFWIYDHLPAGSTITNEYWDDPLPLQIPGRNSNSYTGIMLPLYDPDSPQKWQKLTPLISSANYLLMTSNRLWGSIPLVPHLYPLTSKYYQNLFDGQSQFRLLSQFNSYPGFSLGFLKKCYYIGPTNYPYLNKKNTWFSVDQNCLYPGIYFRDDTADESFTVYDHPKVLIFSNAKNK